MQTSMTKHLKVVSLLVILLVAVPGSGSSDIVGAESPSYIDEGPVIESAGDTYDDTVEATTHNRRKDVVESTKNIELLSDKPHKDAIFKSSMIDTSESTQNPADKSDLNSLICSLAWKDKCLEPFGVAKNRDVVTGFPVVLGETRRAMFKMTSDGFIKHIRSGLCLDGNMEYVTLQECNNQVWKVKGNGYIFTAKSRGRCLTVEDYYLVMNQCVSNHNAQRLFHKTFPIDEHNCPDNMVTFCYL